MQDLINIIQLKHCDTGFALGAPASIEEIKKTELELGFTLPDDFKEFYQICNGFASTEDMFNFFPLKNLMDDRGKDWIIFADCRVYSEVWVLRILKDSYEIFYTDREEIVLTNSLTEFLEVFFTGNVFEKGGLYDWIEKKKSL